MPGLLEDQEVLAVLLLKGSDVCWKCEYRDATIV